MVRGTDERITTSLTTTPVAFSLDNGVFSFSSFPIITEVRADDQSL
jgi:hypothetical protein